MSPIHHHYELLGWPETTVIIRFWIIAGIGVALASVSITPTSPAASGWRDVDRARVRAGRDR